jgi:hypothetical protein
MKTHISEFCTEFSETLFPLAESLGDAVHMLDEVGEASVETLSTSFANLRHRVEALVTKVQGQEAYVLLFGPLKSGKSTLLNAISAGYVSEVTSLPAYPCMVNLKYGEVPKYSVIRYSGKKDQVASPDELKSLLEQSHRTLSDRVRAIEDFGEEFDPTVHLPSAIRRVQVELPAENLRESGTVLVDTPGLYSKMKFGYDAMTQEFRDSAASAVFVVKTDNLFLEQVFDDFNDLLDQFSRVFVVVNIDSGKRDLCPDGTLSPSLESSDPDQVVKAFEALTMSAPLRRAAESGRLHLYPIDLCSAAARRLGSGTEPAEPDDDEPDRFDAFLTDLLDYLNSTDYLLEFMADTIRQSQTVTGDILSDCESEPAVAIRQAQNEVRERLEQIDREHTAANRIRNLDWASRLKSVESAEAKARASSMNDVKQGFQDRAAKAIAGWFASDESLADLRDARLGTLVHEVASSYRDQIQQRLADLADQTAMGLSLDSELTHDIATVGLNLDTVREKALGALSPAAELGAAVQLPLEDIPVRRRLMDKILFRSPAALRRRLFGPDDAPDHPVSARGKEKQLGPEAQDALLGAAETACNRLLERVEEESGLKRLDAFFEGCVKGIQDDLTGIERRLTRERKEGASTAEKLDRLESAFSQLAHVADEVLAKVAELEAKHRPGVQQLNVDQEATREVAEAPHAAASEPEGERPDDQDTDGPVSASGDTDRSEAAATHGAG